MATSSCSFCTIFSSSCFGLPACGARRRWMFCLTSLMSSAFCNSLLFFSLFIINLAWRFCFISSTLFIASTVLFHSSLWYFTGSFLRFSNSNELSYIKKEHIQIIYRNIFRSIHSYCSTQLLVFLVGVFFFDCFRI